MTSETTTTEQAATTTEGSTSANDAPATEQGTTLLTEASASSEQQVSEAQSTESKGDQAQSEGDGEKAEAAPEQYDFKAPEDGPFDNTVIEKFTDVAKKHALTKEVAQDILDQVAPVIRERQVEALKSARAEWVNTTRADKEFGGDKLTENLGVAKKALEAFGTPELKTLLNETGLGDHPEILRAFYRAGKAISEDGFVAAGRTNTTNANDPASKLFPTMRN